MIQPLTDRRTCRLVRGLVASASDFPFCRGSEPPGMAMDAIALIAAVIVFRSAAERIFRANAKIGDPDRE